MALKCGCPSREHTCNTMPTEEFVRQGLGKMSLAEGNARAHFCALLAGGPAVQQFQAGLINGCTLLSLLNQEMYTTLPPEVRFGPSRPVVPHHPVPQQEVPPRFQLPPPMLNPRRRHRRCNPFPPQTNTEDEEFESMYAEDHLEIFAAQCVQHSEAEGSPWAAVSKWQARFPFGAENAPEPPWCKDKHWPQNRWRFKPALPGRVVP